MSKKKAFTTSETIVRNAIISRAGIYPYNGETVQGFNVDPNKQYRVLKSRELIKSLIDRAKMIPVTDGHNGDVIINDGYATTTGGKAPIGTTGSNVVYNEQTGELSVDLRILKNKYDEFKKQNKLFVSMGAVGYNKLEPGVDSEFGEYDAIQYIENVSHLACVKNPRVQNSRIEDENNINYVQTFFINDNEDVAQMENNENKANEEVKTEEVKEEEKEQEEKKEESSPLNNQPDKVEEKSELKKQEFEQDEKFKQIEREFSERLKALEEEKEALKVKIEEEKKIDFLNASVKSLIGEIPQEKKSLLSETIQYLAKKFKLDDPEIDFNYLKGYLKGKTQGLTSSMSGLGFKTAIQDNNDTEVDKVTVKLKELLK